MGYDMIYHHQTDMIFWVCPRTGDFYNHRQSRKHDEKSWNQGVFSDKDSGMEMVITKSRYITGWWFGT